MDRIHLGAAKLAHRRVIPLLGYVTGYKKQSSKLFGSDYSKLMLGCACKDDRTLRVTLSSPTTLSCWDRKLLAFGFPSDSPRSDTIFFVIARPLVHDWRPVGTPIWRSFVVSFRKPFQLNRECADSRTFRKVEGNYLLEALVY